MLLRKPFDCVVIWENRRRNQVRAISPQLGCLFFAKFVAKEGQKPEFCKQKKFARPPVWIDMGH
jgi:hypothetical protein